ncbi:MAG: DNA repair protein RecO [Candidatus Omnitrophica bacterium]|nr:DNA repair protein RecO [Candidatus Omnitrophota bacterium]
MIQTQEAILLRKQDLRETSLLATFYTRGSGRICGVLKGVRGQRGQYGVTPQLFGLSEIVFYERKGRDVFTVSQCELKEFFGQIRESLEKTAYAMYFVELINSLTPLCERNEAMFETLLNCLKLLNGSASAKRVARIFEIRLLALMGLMPELSRCVLCGSDKTAWTHFSFKNGGVLCDSCSRDEKGAVAISTGAINFMGHVHRSDWAMLPRIKVSLDVGRQVEALLERFLDYHLHLRPKSMDFIRKALV